MRSGGDDVRPKSLSTLSKSVEKMTVDVDEDSFTQVPVTMNKPLYSNIEQVISSSIIIHIIKPGEYGVTVRVLASHLGDWGSIPSRVIPKNSKNGTNYHLAKHSAY